MGLLLEVVCGWVVVVDVDEGGAVVGIVVVGVVVVVGSC